jgi:hypothetical protein
MSEIGAFSLAVGTTAALVSLFLSNVLTNRKLGLSAFLAYLLSINPTAQAQKQKRTTHTEE